VALLDALRALTAFDPPEALPPCDLEEVADVLDAHGLAPLASYQLETRRIGASVPQWFRERLLPLYQGVVNDNVFKLLTLKGALRTAEVPVVLLDGAAYVDWIYPHLAFRPIGQVRLAVRGADGARFGERLAGEGFGGARTGPGGHTAIFDDGRIEIRIQEGLVAGRPEDHGLFERRQPFPAIGRTAARPAAEDAILLAVADLALAGLHAPLMSFVDLRELLALPALADGGCLAKIQERAVRAGLARALHGSCALVSHFFPSASAQAVALSPSLGRAERAMVEGLVEAAKDPTRLRLVRGAEAAAKLVVAP
jgi:Uncharacterised nucleotidyltransferase